MPKTSLALNGPIEGFVNKWSPLSNFATDVPFAIDGVTAPSLEHHFAAAKFEDDPSGREEALSAETPGQAKLIGRRANIPSDWNDLRLEVMFDLLRAKYNVTHYADVLKSTKERKLVDSNNWHDDFWGNCICPRHIDKAGRNQLGTMLEFIREEITDGAIRDGAIRAMILNDSTQTYYRENISVLDGMFYTNDGKKLSRHSVTPLRRLEGVGA